MTDCTRQELPGNVSTYVKLLLSGPKIDDIEWLSDVTRSIPKKPLPRKWSSK